MKSKSAGILPYKLVDGELRVLLVHPGGPFWRKKDLGAWSIAKGEIDGGENELAAAIREFQEEAGVLLAGEFLPLGEVKQTGGKTVAAWAWRGDIDPAAIVSNTFELEWPPKSGRRQAFPEIDRAEWFGVDVAREKMLVGQRLLLDRLVAAVGKISRRNNADNN